MPRITKAMLEAMNKNLRLSVRELNQALELQKTQIKVLEDLLKFNPNSGLYMAMMSTNKLARKLIETNIERTR